MKLNVIDIELDYMSKVIFFSGKIDLDFVDFFMFFLISNKLLFKLILVCRAATLIDNAFRVIGAWLTWWLLLKVPHWRLLNW